MLVISYFDDIYGPQILDIYPRQADVRAMQISQILSLLIDVASQNEEEEWIFIYADKNFSSQNLRKTYVNTEARGDLTDLLISVILHPTHFNHISAMAQGWNAIFHLENVLTNELEFEQSRPVIEDTIEFTGVLKSFYKDVKEQYQFFLDSIEPSAHLIK